MVLNNGWELVFLCLHKNKKQKGKISIMQILPFYICLVVILSEVLSGSLLTSKTDVYSNCDTVIYNGFAFSKLICEWNKQSNIT